MLMLHAPANAPLRGAQTPMPPKRKTSGPKKTALQLLRLAPALAPLLQATDTAATLGTITEDDILSAVSPTEVVKLINSLTTTAQDEIFSRFRTKAEAQAEHNQKLILELTRQLDNLQLEVASKQAEIDQLQLAVGNQTHIKSNTPIKSNQTFASPIRRKTLGFEDADVGNEIPADQLSRELELVGITLDILELLTGLRVANYEEDATSFYFDITQSSTNAGEEEEEDKLTVEYRLTIRKDTAHAADISYEPIFLDAADAAGKLRARVLTSILPEYFCDNLMFPYNTLAQFYAKMGRALNKGKR